jgi:hypothetical protein
MLTMNSIILGSIFITIGLCFLVSPRFVAFAIAIDGGIWRALFGHRATAFLTRYVFSFVSIGLGVCVIYFGYGDQ